jgi:hypothetical protein
MFKRMTFAAALLLGASSAAIAQEVTPPAEPVVVQPTVKAGLGVQVRALAKGQRGAETRGIGKQVRELARAQGDGEAPEEDEGEVVGASASGEVEVERTAEERAAAKAARAEAKAAKSAARETSKAARDEAKAARQAAKDAAKDARRVRDTVKAARRGRGK